jgi:hypothetical protein
MSAYPPWAQTLTMEALELFLASTSVEKTYRGLINIGIPFAGKPLFLKAIVVY